MRLLLALAIGWLLALTATAGATIIHATPSTFGSSWTAARGGDTILLAAGSYGSWSPTTKGTMVTVKPEDGAAVSMAPQFVGSSFITVQGVRFSSPVVMRDSTNHVVLDGDSFDNLGQATWEGRLSLNLGAHDNTVRNSHFGGNAGCSDGVFVGDAPANTIGPGNEFTGIKQGSCGPHTDSIQLYDGPRTTIVGNYFHDSDTHIMAPDGGTSSVITDNVMIGAGYAPTVQLGSHQGTSFVHNTTRNVNVHMDSKTGGTPSRNGVVRDNVILGGQVNTTNGNGCTGCSVDHNLMSGAVFVGGANPTTYAGYQLAASSPGKGAATDGLDQGIRVTGGPPPPPPPADTDPPQTTITQAPVDGQATSALVAFTSSEAGTFQCKLDAAAYAECVSPQQLAGLAAGDHTFSVRSVDQAGNTDLTPATATWTVTAPPPPPPSCQDQLDALQQQLTAALDDLAQTRSELADTKVSLASVQALADAYKARAEKAETVVDKVRQDVAP